jgi:hypothetical protein
MRTAAEQGGNTAAGFIGTRKRTRGLHFSFPHLHGILEEHPRYQQKKEELIRKPGEENEIVLS